MTKNMSTVTAMTLTPRKLLTNTFTVGSMYPINVHD